MLEGWNLTLHAHSLPLPVEQWELQIDRPGGLEDIGYMTCMTLVLLGNYAQTGHFGGPLAYTPYNVAAHLAGPELGGLRYDYRRPKHPFCDKFMLAGGHNIPTGYALWMIMGQALERKFKATGDARYYVDPKVAILPIDALGFRRGAGALKNLLQDLGLADYPLFAQAKLRGIKALAGHAESVDVTNDVNGGPSGIGIATSAGKAAFWNIVGAPSSLKVIALEGEFALTEGHAQELKTQALALQVGKRLRILLSDNNAGIDDVLLGGVVDRKFDAYRLVDQWTSYGWNVLTLPDGNDYSQIISALKTMEDWDDQDRRPILVIGLTTKGYWPGAVDGKIPGGVEPARRPLRVVADTAEEPQIAAFVCESCSVISAAWHVRGRRSSQRAVNARGATVTPGISIPENTVGRLGAASPNPPPLGCNRIKLPKIVQVAPGARCVVTVTSKQPQISIRIGPTGRSFARPGCVTGRWRSLGPINSRLLNKVCS